MTIVDTDVLIDFLSGKAPRSVEDALARGTLSTCIASESRLLTRNAREYARVPGLELVTV